MRRTDLRWMWREPRHRAMTASLLVSLLMLGGKAAAYVLTGSAAIFSDAAESVIHLFATGFAGFSLWYAVQPPDEDHPYGHGKIAYFSSGFEGAMILTAALAILYSAVRALIEGPALRQLDLGGGLLAGLCVVNLVLGRYLVRTGRRHDSVVLVSNGQHVLTDVWTTLGVLVGLLLVRLTGLRWLDPVVAILVALNIFWTASRLLGRAARGLMEKADTADTRVILHELERAVAAGVISGYHQLRHRRVNDALWVEYHVQLPGGLSITEAHARAQRVEDAIVGRFAADVYVTAHLEPEAHAEAHPAGHAEPVDALTSG